MNSGRPTPRRPSPLVSSVGRQIYDHRVEALIALAGLVAGISLALALVAMRRRSATEATQPTVGFDVARRVVELMEPGAVVVDADVRDVRGHELQRVPPAEVEQFAVAGGVEREDGAAILEALRPFGPAAGGVSSFDGEDRRALALVPCAFDQPHLPAGKVKDAVERAGEVRRGQGAVDVHRVNLPDGDVRPSRELKSTSPSRTPGTGRASLWRSPGNDNARPSQRLSHLPSRRRRVSNA